MNSSALHFQHSLTNGYVITMVSSFTFRRKTKVPYECIWKANNNNDNREMAVFAYDKLSLLKRAGVLQSSITAGDHYALISEWVIGVTAMQDMKINSTIDM